MKNRPTVRRILKLIRDDGADREYLLNDLLERGDHKGLCQEKIVLDYIDWLVEHIEYWVEHGEQP